MATIKVGRAGRFFVLFCLLLTGLLFAGCQTSKVESGFSEVPGIENTTPTVNPATTSAMPNASTNTGESWEFIKPGDVLVVTFGDLPQTSKIDPFDTRVRDDGTITLIYNQPFKAAGKRTGDLEKEIHDFYVPKYFINLTVTVRIAGDRFIYVDGEVKVSGNIKYVPGITVSKAIASAGGFTDFANKRAVRLIRPSGKIQKVNCNKVLNHPELDPMVFPDDKIHVPRRIFW